MPLPLAAPGHQAAAGSDFVWFVYGSSLDGEAFRTWADEHGYPLPDMSRAFPARLDGWRLRFDVASRYWGGAVASLAPEAGRFVEGLALPMAGAARGLADHKEGAVSGLFRPQAVEVRPLAGGPPVAAVAYLSSPERR
ncbi:MAG TPA: gamma-glutamylcyclotransferase family protein, partial [Anaeromyxobacteraceae bacterium]|nr:gamma-glutamylcyclotransferase family protein [Anaeromyxobacteraceae bacterium]